jgi:hypothetical protein
MLVAFALSPWGSDAADLPPATQSKESAQRASKVEEAEPDVDVALLEFLGSVDSEDGELIDYYARGDRERKSQSTTTGTAPDTVAGAGVSSKAKPSADEVLPQTTRNHE